MNPALIHHCNIMVQTALTQGHKPAVFLMNATTKAALAETLLYAEKARRSAWTQFWTWLRGEKFELTHLLGVPVCENNHLPDGFISLQVAMEGAAPGLGGAQSAQNAPAKQENPFQRRERVEAPVGASEDRAPTLSDLAASGSGRVTPSAVLMKSLEDCDDLASIIVVRVHRNNDVSLCMTCNSFEATGVLNRAQMWLAMRGQ